MRKTFVNSGTPFLISTALVCLLSVDSWGGRPDWTLKPPKGTCFEYFAGLGESFTSEVEAKRRAIADALHQMASSEKVQVQSQIVDIMEEVNSEIYQAVMREILVKGESSQLEGVKIEELYLERPEQGCYKYWALVRVPWKGVDWRRCPEPKEYGLGPVWRSVLVPGWGQFYKQHKTKAWLFFTSEVVLVATALYADWKGDDERQKASDPRNVRWTAIRDYHNDRADQFYSVSMATGLMAGALYVYNILDTRLTTGARRYAACDEHPTYVALLSKRDSWQLVVALRF